MLGACYRMIHSIHSRVFSESPEAVEISLSRACMLLQADFWIIFAASVVWAYLAIWDLKKLV